MLACTLLQTLRFVLTRGQVINSTSSKLLTLKEESYPRCRLSSSSSCSSVRATERDREDYSSRGVSRRPIAFTNLRGIPFSL